ncbi:MAG: hypothetical protein ACRDDX_06120 [Cellulosilyticaceae bacterium]
MMDIMLDLLGDIIDVSDLDEAVKGIRKAVKNSSNSMVNDNSLKNRESYNEDTSQEEVEEQAEMPRVAKRKKLEKPKQKQATSNVGPKAYSTQKVVTQTMTTRDLAMSQQKLKEGIILSEILGPPVSRKRRNRMGRI